MTSRPPKSRSAGPLGRVAGSIATRPWIAISAWALIVGVAAATALAGVGGDTLFGRLKASAPTATSESSKADVIISGAGGKSDSTTLLVQGVNLDDPALAAAGKNLSSRLTELANTTFLDPLAVPMLPDGSRAPTIAALISTDGRGVLYTAIVAGVENAEPSQSAIDEVDTAFVKERDVLRSEFPRAVIEIGGERMLTDSIISTSQSDLERGEAIALPIALVVMLIVFGGFIAAGMPLIGAIAAIIGSFGALLGFSYFMDIDSSVINVVTAVGLGLSIDYGLLMVSRFREELRALDAAPGALSRQSLRIAAISRTAETAGRTVLFSGITFAIATLGLLAFEPRIVRAIGIGAFAVTAIAILSALTLIPALLALTGDKLIRPGALTRIPRFGRAITRFGDIAPDQGFFSRLTRLVQKRPALVTILCAFALVAFASPALSLRLANTSVDALPAASEQYAFLTTFDADFPDAASPRVALVTDTQADATAWATTVESLPNVKSVGAPRKSGDGWISAVRVDPTHGLAVVTEIRSHRPSFRALVTGDDAHTLDFSQSLIDSAPLPILIIAFGTIALLFLMTGSLIVPLKALAASALSLGASVGVLVWGFQDGNFAGIMGFDASRVHGVDVIVLVLTLTFGFGLAMDYEMFILSRIKEARDAGLASADAIARGLQRSGRIITSAALIIVVVFAGFATGDLMLIKQLGIALAVAVTLDATLVRLLLVPAFMTWQQRIMWWAPKWMKRLHAKFGLTEGA